MIQADVKVLLVCQALAHHMNYSKMVTTVQGIRTVICEKITHHQINTCHLYSNTYTVFSTNKVHTDNRFLLTVTF